MRRINGFDGRQQKILPFALDGASSFYMKDSIRADRCDCAPGECAAFVDPPTSCVHRLEGDIRTAHCAACFPDSQGQTWHQDGACLRCRLRLGNQ